MQTFSLHGLVRQIKKINLRILANILFMKKIYDKPTSIKKLISMNHHILAFCYKDVKELCKVVIII